MGSISDVAFTPAVKRVQEREGSRKAYAARERTGGWKRRIEGAVAEFVAASVSFYFGTASAAGRPYIQHRGGPPGFLKILDAETLAFADFGGNRQYISVGNLSENDQAFLFLMDYANPTRFKLWGRAEITEDESVVARVRDDHYGAVIERAIVFHVEAWDQNCPQHIPRRFDEAQVEAITAPLHARIAELEAQLGDRADA